MVINTVGLITTTVLQFLFVTLILSFFLFFPGFSGFK